MCALLWGLPSMCLFQIQDPLAIQDKQITRLGSLHPLSDTKSEKLPFFHNAKRN